MVLTVARMVRLLAGVAPAPAPAARAASAPVTPPPHEHRADPALRAGPFKIGPYAMLKASQPPEVPEAIVGNRG